MGHTVMTCLTIAAVVSAAAPSLSAPDIEKATGLQGIHVVIATAPGAVTGRENFADSSGTIVLWFHKMTGAGFARAKAQPAKKSNGIVVEPALYHGSIAGLGDEAFDSPAGTGQHALYVRKGDAAFGLIANVDARGKPRLTMEQLKALAKTVLARM